jgi:hypothetical protein
MVMWIGKFVMVVIICDWVRKVLVLTTGRFVFLGLDSRISD